MLSNIFSQGSVSTLHSKSERSIFSKDILKFSPRFENTFARYLFDICNDFHLQSCKFFISL